MNPAYVQELVAINSRSGDYAEKETRTNPEDWLTIQVIAPEEEDCMAMGKCI